MWDQIVQKIKGKMWGLLAVLSFVGVTLFDISIFGSRSVTGRLLRYFETQTGENQLPSRNIENETETGIKQWSPINEANKEPEKQTPSDQTDADEVRKLEFSRLIGILEDLSTNSTRWGFIKANEESIPDSLSLDELRRILDLFSTNSYRLSVIQLFLSRLPDSLSLGELNQVLDRFSTHAYKLDVTEMFQSRLEEIYSDSDFEIYKKHYNTDSYKMAAIELLLRKDQKQ